MTYTCNRDNAHAFIYTNKGAFLIPHKKSQSSSQRARRRQRRSEHVVDEFELHCNMHLSVASRFTLIDKVL
jgi:hypothetical protein